jgi:sugar phosphate isomerase/epimerase
MKLSTTTLGCFKWDLPTVLERVAGYGFEGIDFRGLQGELKLWLLPEFSTGLADTASCIRDLGLTVTCISSGILLSDTRPEHMAEHDEELVRSAEICRALGCRQIRVFGGSLGLAGGATEADRERVVDLVAARARDLAERAGQIAPVDLLIETHDAWTSSRDMVAALERCNRPDVACCWDLKHTYWTGKETPETSWERLAPWVRNTHWKDVRRCCGSPAEAGRDLKGSGVLCLVGDGIAPLTDCYDLLTTAGYDGWFTLEWEKRWHPYLDEPDVAFPGFVRYLRDLEARW